MPKIAQLEKRGRGRPKSFDRNEALDIAMKLFWDRGFEGTNLDDLITAMGISCSSFYNTFSSKEALYEEATTTYLAAASDWFLGELNAPGKNTRTAIEGVLKTSAKQYTSRGLPCGCMIALAGTHLPPELDSIRELTARQRQSTKTTIAARIKKGVQQGDVRADIKVEPLAEFYTAVSRGMAVHARDGATRKQLLDIVDVAMQAWPK